MRQIPGPQNEGGAGPWRFIRHEEVLELWPRKFIVRAEGSAGRITAWMCCFELLLQAKGEEMSGA